MTKKRELMTIPETMSDLEAPKTLTKGRKPNDPNQNRIVKEVYSSNPYARNGTFHLQVEQRTEVVSRNLEVVDKDNNTIAEGAVVRYRKVDPAQYIKLFSQNIGAFFNLNSTAQKTLVGVIRAIQDQSRDKAEIYLRYESALKYYKEIDVQAPSKTTFYKGINLLIQAQFIALSDKGTGWYWTNPNILFNGSRVAFAEVIVDEKREELKQTNELLETKLKEQSHLR